MGTPIIDINQVVISISSLFLIETRFNNVVSSNILHRHNFIFIQSPSHIIINYEMQFEGKQKQSRFSWMRPIRRRHDDHTTSSHGLRANRSSKTVSISRVKCSRSHVHREVTPYRGWRVFISKRRHIVSPVANKWVKMCLYFVEVTQFFKIFHILLSTLVWARTKLRNRLGLAPPKNISATPKWRIFLRLWDICISILFLLFKTRKKFDIWANW